ncbi:hypothetical protein ABI59_20865 [Acidobacteria bacterium Mor1]|nr:hypothetical protein ABI59_20865 [Acidobacteria bacterium Mor1]
MMPFAEWSLRFPALTWLLETELRVSLILVSAMGIGALLRRRSARVRRMVWVVALAMSLGFTVAGLVRAIDGLLFGPRWVTGGTTNLQALEGALFAILLLPAALLLLRLCIAWFGVEGMLADSEPVRATAWLADRRRIASSLDMAPAIPIRVTTRLTSPVTVGLRRPRILIPANLLDADARFRDAVLRHELAHVKRRDIAARWLAGVTCALQWFHPLAWVVSRRLHRDCELACDESALGGGLSRAVYARHLLALAGDFGSNASLVGFGCGVSELRERIEALAGRRESRTVPLPLLGLLGATVFVAALAIELPRPRLMFIPAAEEASGVELRPEAAAPPGGHRDADVDRRPAAATWTAE